MRKMKCGCGKMADVRISQGKHKIPYLVCPDCGPIMGRKKAHIERINRESVEVDESDENQMGGSEKKADCDAGHESDSSRHDTPRKSLFAGWGTVL